MLATSMLFSQVWLGRVRSLGSFFGRGRRLVASLELVQHRHGVAPELLPFNDAMLETNPLYGSSSHGPQFTAAVSD